MAIFPLYQNDSTVIVSKSISLTRLLRWQGGHFVWLFALMGTVSFLYANGYIGFVIPWLPMTVIGTAVAFYAGFKNNQAYDRMWEARKIWGGIVNDSRSWGMMVDGFITDLVAQANTDPEHIKSIKQRLIYRHIAWLYAHRSQLLVTTTWEHANQRGMQGKAAAFYQQRFGIGLVDDEVTRIELRDLLLREDEHDRLVGQANTATQIINAQSRDLRELRKAGLLDDFRHMEMTDVLRSFYTLQGKNERIKKFPCPVNTPNMSRYFTGIFIALLPFTMIPELIGLGAYGAIVAVPVAVLVAWIYLTMELVGDYSENPFQGMANDIPMLSLCRVIEIDLREMLGETDLPPGIQAKNNVLM